MYLMMRRAFDELGYRRYEWKCDALNAASRRAAARLGFTYEGTFRQATHYKGRNRDTAWFAILDSEWPAIRDAQERWLDPANFDTGGQQKVSLSALDSPTHCGKRRAKKRWSDRDRPFPSAPRSSAAAILPRAKEGLSRPARRGCGHAWYYGGSSGS